MRLIAAATALTLLASCNLADRQRQDNASANGEGVGNVALSALNGQDANSAAPIADETNAQLAAAPPPRRDPSGVDREWFTGLWTDTGDCADAGQFGRDGRYRLADGTRGMWNVQGGRLVIENAGGRRVIRVRKVAEDAVETVSAEGQASRSTRCARVTPRVAPIAVPESKPVEPPPPDLAD